MKEAILTYAREQYGTDPERPFSDPDILILRHRSNRKWYAAFMRVPRSKLGLPGGETVDILDLKCDPLLSGSLRQDPGVFPGYHMNKTHWITVLLDGTVPLEEIRAFLDMSYALTKGKK